MYIGFSGRFVEEKGFDILLQAIPEVIKSIPSAHFVFAGETHIAYEQFFERWQREYKNVASHITNLGLLSRDEMPSFFHLLSLFVMPSRSECMGLVQVEAMLAGVSVVATDIPGGRVPVKETGMGMLVRPEDPQALAEGIITVMKKRSFYQKSKRRAQSFFDYKKTLDLYEHTISQGK